MINTSLLTLDDCPSWRWDRIVRHVEDGTNPSRITNDDFIRKGWLYLRRLNTCQDANDIAWLTHDYPAVHKAYCLFENTQSLRWVVEACLLTQSSWDEIYAYTGINIRVLQAYEAYFFNVRDKLHFRGYIASRILIPVATNGSGAKDYDFMLKAVAYFGGWEILKELLNIGPMEDASKQWFESSFTAELWRKGLLAVRRLDPNNFNATEVIGNVMKMIEVQHEIKTAKTGVGGEQDKFLTELQGLLNSCPTVTMKNAEIPMADEPRILASNALGNYEVATVTETPTNG